eukprot:8417206-Lingulodinium_polyedra.AAC.1
MDDLKIAASQEKTASFLAALEKVFGKLTVHVGDFVHCGLRHVQAKDFSVTADQSAYVANLRCIDETALRGAPDDQA